jgi:hypothetical protein
MPEVKEAKCKIAVVIVLALAGRRRVARAVPAGLCANCKASPFDRPIKPDERGKSI